MKNNNTDSNRASNQAKSEDTHQSEPTLIITPHDASRRAFVKKSLAAGIIAAQPTILAGLIRADGGSGGQTTTSPWGTTYQTTYETTYATTAPVWEYMLRCLKDPGNYGMASVKRLSPDVKSWANCAITTWGDEAVRVGTGGSGPQKNDVADSFTFIGNVDGHYSDDVDDGTPVKAWADLGQSPLDQDPDDVVANAHAQTPQCTITLTDGPTGKCSWTPNVLAVHSTSVQELTVSLTVRPLLGIIGLAAVATPNVTMGLSLQYEGVGASYQVTRPNTTRKAEGELLWDLEVVRRLVGSSDPWVRHSPVTLDPSPELA